MFVTAGSTNGVCNPTSEIYTVGEEVTRQGPTLPMTLGVKAAGVALNSSHVVIYGGYWCGGPAFYSDMTWLLDLAQNDTRLVASNTVGGLADGMTRSRCQPTLFWSFF